MILMSHLLILVEAPLTLALRAYPIHIRRRTSGPFRMDPMYNYQSSTKSIFIDPDSFETVRELVEGEELLVPMEGDPHCPCLPLQELPPFSFANTYEGELGGTLEGSLESYGVGCNYHDKTTQPCIDGCPTNDTACDRSWCARQFCWVDPDNCLLQYKTSSYAKGRFYSYATCRYVDSFSSSARIKTLAGKTLKIGMNSNLGGYRGAYNANNSHFDGPLSRWYGPIVEFVKKSADYAGFELELVNPPDYIKERSHQFWNNSSPFEECIYAAALGIVDFCVSQYLITAPRTGTAEWIVTDEQSLRLITQVQGIIVVTDWFSLLDKFGSSFNIISQPFEKGTWIFLILFMVPVMGIMFIIHEFGRPGASYQPAETVIVENEDGTTEVTHRVISIWEHLGIGLYNSFLAVLQGGYDDPTVSNGGLLHLLGMAFFILTIIAVYTANLAAILTDRALQGDVTSVTRALQQSYRFCAERHVMEIFLKSNFHLDDSIFALDPPELGGDNLPGFLNGKQSLFDRVDERSAETDPTYCHAAITFLQDLEVEQGQGRHCNKTAVGVPLGNITIGIPIYAGKYGALSALFAKTINLNILAKEARSQRPDKKCDAVESQIRGETKSLSIEQLNGIWCITFFFAILSLGVEFFKPWRPIKIRGKRKKPCNPDLHEKRIEAVGRMFSDQDEESGNSSVATPVDLSYLKKQGSSIFNHDPNLYDDGLPPQGEGKGHHRNISPPQYSSSHDEDVNESSSQGRAPTPPSFSKGSIQTARSFNSSCHSHHDLCDFDDSKRTSELDLSPGKNDSFSTHSNLVSESGVLPGSSVNNVLTTSNPGSSSDDDQ